MLAKQNNVVIPGLGGVFGTKNIFLVVFMAFTGLLKHAVSIHTFLMDLAARVYPL